MKHIFLLIMMFFCFSITSAQGSGTSLPESPTSTSAHVPNRGLVNLGNSCYLNALIQAVNNCTPLKDIFITRGSPTVGENKQLVTEFIKTLEELSKSDNTQAFNPTNLYQCFTGLKNRNGSFKFPPGTQQDADEGFHAIREIFNFAPRVIDYITPGTIVTCLNSACKKISPPARQNAEFALHLEINQDKSGPIAAEDVIRSYSHNETVEGKCDFCRSEEKPVTDLQVSHFFTIDKSALFLVLNIGRFSWNMVTGEPKKIVMPVIFPETGIIDIADGRGEPHKFKVASVIIHSGASAKGGHYWCITQAGIYEDHNVALDSGAAYTTLMRTGINTTSGWLGQGYVYLLERIDQPLTPSSNQSLTPSLESPTSD